MKDRSYESLVSGMSIAPGYTSAEEVIRKDFKVKLPGRRYTHMWNSPELEAFRGVQGQMDKEEVSRHVVQAEAADIRRAAREQDVSTPDMSYVREAMNQQRQQASAMSSHMETWGEYTLPNWQACMLRRRRSSRGWPMFKVRRQRRLR